MPACPPGFLPCLPCLQVLSGAVPPLPSRYSQDLLRLVAAMLQQAPASRPTVDDILQSPAVGNACLGGVLLLVSSARGWRASQGRLYAQ